MKRMFLFLLAAALLTVSVSVDFGPKDQLTVRVENGPEELAALDRDLLEALTAAIPQGRMVLGETARTAASGSPMWGFQRSTGFCW